MKVVFHVNDLDNYSAAISNIHNILKLDITKVILLFNGSAIKIFENDDLDPKIQDDRFTMYACQNSMKTHNIKESDLFENVSSVISGVFTLTELQTQGFAYIKP